MSKNKEKGRFIASFTKCAQIKKDKQLDELVCILGISVGQKYHQGTKLAAIVEAINKTFSKCIIVIGDTLQRYNFQMEGIAEDTAKNKALVAGQEWIIENKKTIDQLTTETEIFFWDTWLGLHQDIISTPQITIAEFQEQLTYMQNLYKNHTLYKSYLEQVISAIQQKTAQNSIKTQKEKEHLIKKYIEEELAVMLLWEKKRPNSIFIYPNSSSKIALLVHQCFNEVEKSQGPSFKLYLDNINFSKLKNLESKEIKQVAKIKKINSAPQATQTNKATEKELLEIRRKIENF